MEKGLVVIAIVVEGGVIGNVRMGCSFTVKQHNGCYPNCYSCGIGPI